MDISRVIQNNKYMFRFISRSSKSYVFVNFLYQLLENIPSLLFNTLGMKYILDNLASGDSITPVLWMLTIYGTVTVIALGFNAWRTTYFNGKVTNLVNADINLEMMEKSAKVDLACFDDADFYDTHVRALGETHTRAFRVADTLVDLATNVFSIITVISIIIWLDPIIVLITFGSIIIQSVTSTLYNNTQYQSDKIRTRNQRLRRYLTGIFYDQKYAKELRLYDMNKLLLNKFLACVDEFYELIKKFAGRIALWRTIMDVTDLLCMIGIMVYLSIQVYSGKISVGDFVALFGAFASLRGSLTKLFKGISRVYENSLYIENFRKIMDYQPTIDKEIPQPYKVRKNSSHSIEFKNVSFAYPNSKTLALKNVSFRINAGQKVAIVGSNGAGKSTIVKLLTRLYDPTEGHILIDGQDIRNYKLSDLRQTFSITFQDFQVYSFTVGENVLLKEIKTQEDEEKVWEALKLGSLESKISSLPKGIHTMVTRQFDSGGVVFSGGESQKLVLSRIYAQSGGIIVLDEPSSALDPLSEHELYQRLMSESSIKSTMIFISHRLATTREADMILVMEDGELLEFGTHAELMSSGSLYSKLYSLQAQRYVG